jgi:hypothetical protein
VWAEDWAINMDVVSVWAAFTLEASLLCISEVAGGLGEVCVLGAGQVPIHSRCP